MKGVSPPSFVDPNLEPIWPGIGKTHGENDDQI